MPDLGAARPVLQQTMLKFKVFLKKSLLCGKCVFYSSRCRRQDKKCVLSHSGVNALSVSLPLNFYETISNHSISIANF